MQQVFFDRDLKTSKAISRRLAIGLATALLCASAIAQTTALQSVGPHDAIFMNKTPDREAWLLERARKEGAVTLYTSLAPTESVPLMAEFEKKYGIKVTVWRGLSDGVVQRVVNEGRAKRHTVDVVETNGPEMEMLAREKMLSEFHSPHIADLPQGMIPKHRMWMPDRVNFFVVAFNTQKVKREDLPKHYEGFTEPKWKGRIAIESTDAEWMGGLVNALGEQRGMTFFRKLSEQKPDVRKGHILLAQMVAAGETDVGLTIYNANAQSLKQRGAPIDWVPIEPTLARPQGVGVARNAPHPHAAALLADFFLSPEAQTLLNSLGRPPASQKVKSNLNNFNYVLTDPGIVVDEAEKWNQHWTRLFLTK
jgi:iron(III) transport system substrate-binding protein